MSLTRQAKAILSRLGTRPRKSWGQNFMVSSSGIQAIVHAADLNTQDTVIEVGAGLGFLTEYLSKCAGRVVAVEKDELFAQFLKEHFEPDSKVEIVEADILHFPFSDYKTPIACIGNIPYQITSPLLERLIENRKALKKVLLTIQKDVALRLIAKPGSRDRSALTCWMEMHAGIRRIRDFGKDTFYPAPKVESSLIAIDFFKEPLYPADKEQILNKFIHTAFQKKRKNLLNALPNSDLGITKDHIRSALERSHLDPRLRPESLTPQDWLSLVAV